MDFCQGITLHHLPGHTDGLIGMQINMPETGTFFFISDHCHVIENVSLPGSLCLKLANGLIVARWYSSRMARSRPPSLVQEYPASKATGEDNEGTDYSWT